MASTAATVADFRGLNDAQVHHYATVALEALRERATDTTGRAFVDSARHSVMQVGGWIENLNGHCDTCGALCDDRGCVADREHVVALDV
jgi:hypothetical protein